MSQSGDDNVVLELLREALEKFTRAKLIELEITQDNPRKELEATDDEPFSKVSLSKIPANAKLKVKLTIEEPESGRQISGIASTETGPTGRLRHLDDPRELDVPVIETLPKETDRKNRVRLGKVVRILDFIFRVAQAFISIINALINYGVIKVGHSNVPSSAEMGKGEVPRRTVQRDRT